MTATQTRLLRIEDYERMPENGRREELVRGRIVGLTSPKPKHGLVCATIAAELHYFVREHALGRVFANDTGIITQRDPDTLRGADVAYWSYERLPRGPLPTTYLRVAPDVVFEVLSPDDRRSQMLEKVAEYLNAGVSTVCVADPDRQSVTVYKPDAPEQVLTSDDTLHLDELPGSAFSIGRFFAD